jgi:hypothetical protein
MGWKWKHRRGMCVMSRWHAHGPWCHDPYVYPPPGYAAADYYPPPAYYPPPRARAGRRLDADELAEYLQRLEDEVARVRRDLDELRGSSADRAVAGAP